MTAAVWVSVLVTAGLLSGCRPGYVAQVGIQHLRYISRARPISEEIARTTDPERRRRLELVLAAREFAAASGLEPGGSYLKVANTDGLSAGYVVTAARRDRLELYQWSYPVVGKIPYRGYFERESAEAFAETMEEEGYDTYIFPAAGYSTLGWFDDPLPSTALRYSDTSLVELVIHELVHQNVYVKGEIAFNETLASGIAKRLTIEFFRARSGAGPAAGASGGAGAAGEAGAAGDAHSAARAGASGAGVGRASAGSGGGAFPSNSSGTADDVFPDSDSHAAKAAKAEQDFALWVAQSELFDHFARRLISFYAKAAYDARIDLLAERAEIYRELEQALSALEKGENKSEIRPGLVANNAVFLALWGYRKRAALITKYLDSFDSIAEAVVDLQAWAKNTEADPYASLQARLASRSADDMASATEVSGARLAGSRFPGSLAHVRALVAPEPPTCLF